MGLMLRTTLLLLVVQLVVHFSNGYAVIEMWERGCKGGWYRNDRIENNVCFSWPSAGGTGRGIQMSYGSCLAIFRSTGCSNSNGYLSSLNVCYNAHIYSARVCTRTDTVMQCPEGQRVKALEISADGLAGGLSVQCYASEASVASTPNEIYNLRIDPISNPTRLECASGIVGLANQVDEARDIVISTTPVCEAEVGQCPQGQAVVGITASIEEHTELVKEISVICAPATA